jgi:hypothetical protein
MSVGSGLRQAIALLSTDEVFTSVCVWCAVPRVSTSVDQQGNKHLDSAMLLAHS